MMGKFFRSVPVVFWISFIWCPVIMFSLVYARNHTGTSLLIIITFISMVMVSGYIIGCFSSVTFASTERKRLRGVFPGRRGKLKGIISDSSTLIVIFFIAAATAISGVGFNYGIFLLGVPEIFSHYCFVIIIFYACQGYEKILLKK